MCLKINAKKELVPFAAAADLLSRELSLLHMVILCCLLSRSPLLVSLPLKPIDLAVTLFSSFFFFFPCTCSLIVQSTLPLFYAQERILQYKRIKKPELHFCSSMGLVCLC